MNKKFVKICIFNPDSTPSAVKTSNGDVILDNICLQAITDEILDTGEYYLDCKFKVDNKLYKYIQEESILKVKVDYGNEYFRIAKIRKTSRDIVVFARQITISETLDMWLEDVRPEGQNGQGALSWILDNSKGKKDIRVFSDLENNSTAYYINMSMYKALHDCDQSFKNRWGGEVQRRGYDLTINRKIGKHRGVQIRSRKNLKGFEFNTNIDNLVTRIKPVGFNGITIDGYVDSPLINNYSSIKTREIKYEDIKVKTENDKEGFNTLAEAQEELIRRANLEFTVNNLDKIRADYRVNFVQLEYTEEYKNYVQAERVYLGDEIDVYEEILDVDITVRSIRKKFDVISQKVIEIELSNEVKKDKPPSIGDISNALSKLETTTNEQNTWLENAINNANDLIHNGLKDSYVIVKQNEVLIMDTTDINTANNVWRWNSGGLAHSKNGYYGDYSTAITQDGSIVATMITSGILNANLLQTGVIRSKNKNFELNLDSGVMKVLNGSFKLMVDGNEEDILYSSRFEIAKDEILFQVGNSSQPNIVANGTPTASNTAGWYTDNGGWFYTAGLHPDHSVGLATTESHEGYSYTEFYPVKPNTTYTVYAKVLAENNTKGADVFALGSQSTAGEFAQVVEFLNVAPGEEKSGYRVFRTNGDINYLRLRVDNNGYNGAQPAGGFVVWMEEFMILEGAFNNPNYRPSSNQILNNVLRVNNEGMEIEHNNNSKAKFTHEAIDFLNSQGRRTLRIKDGGFNFHTWQDPAELVGFIKSSVMPSMNNYNGVTLSTYGLGDYIAIGTSTSQDENSWLNNPNIFIASHGGMGSVTKAGTWFLNEQVYSRTAINAYSGITLNPDAQFPHRIYNSTENKLCVFGDNHTALGIKYGNENRTAIEITEDEGQVSKTYIHAWGDWDFHNYTIRNVKVSGFLEAQSSMLRSFLKAMPSQVNDTYSVMSTTDGELRYTQRKTEHITNKTLMVELPHVFSENIELDYHVNISKLSWGDYRIIEKTQYYFEIETNVDDFSFTYEVVAKLIEKPDANVSIAKSQYMLQDIDEVSEESDEIKPIIEI